MQVEARFRRRAGLGENVAELNARLLGALSQLHGLWADDKTAADANFDAGTGESAAVDLTPCLVASVKGSISYASRLIGAVADRATSDDSIVLQLNSDVIDLGWFSREVFPEVIKAFAPYRAALVTDLDQDLEDFESIVQEVQRTGRDVDGRDTVWRFHSVNYFDDALCLRAFGISASEVVARLEGSIELAKSYASGAFLLITPSVVEGDDAIALDSTVRQKLRS